ncbi:fibrinogen-like protein 1 [Poeciliopsis prolifica]|uniref:fibrinogen-like protein 1 n=1 Tax=Poeciliopsis prolifica TaxID=188132 RepID=UPI002413E11F|nr:fibrinogen-like protein 1 [Poeciliopsis prolifica]XP_054911460.1 fibrinogen-like protein 1 [Poeciliopsis prolifica]
MKALFGFLGLVLTAALSRSDQAADLPSDCSKLRPPSLRPSIYLIQPTGSQTRFEVFCHNRRGVGWLVIQRRTGAATYFGRTWEEYKNGFGYMTYDHWLGLEKVHILTNDTSKVWTLRVDLWDHNRKTAYAEYRDFRIGDEGTAYRLHVGAYNGTAGDAIRFSKPGGDQNGAKFSTLDRPNDKCSTPCYHEGRIVRFCISTCCTNIGGWWHNRVCCDCLTTNLNGFWHREEDAKVSITGLHWLTWRPMPYSARYSMMSIRAD